MTTILIAGVAGFIGSNFARYLNRNRPDLRLVGIDYLSSASVYSTIAPLVEAGDLHFVKADINDTETVTRIYREHGVTRVINFAAESHNDRAILDPTPFMLSNALGAQQLLEVSRKVGVARHVHISTIEVYGEQAPGAPPFSAASPLAAKTPYAAAKAAGDLIVRAYMQTYPDMDIVLTHAGNNYGPWQFPEKLIPLCITNVLRGRKIPVYGDGLQERDWLHVADHCRALEQLLLSPRRFLVGPGAAVDPAQLPIYDISARSVVSNLQIVRLILSALDRPFDDWVEHVTDRPNHDRRYVIDPVRIESELGWQPEAVLEADLEETVRWYVDNAAWWQPIVASSRRLQFDWAALKI
jgi:dTDP-glucose 4,6-dehydratase